MDERRYSRIENGKRISYEKTIRALLQQCTDDGLTVEQALFCLDLTRREIEEMAMRAPIAI